MLPFMLGGNLGNGRNQELENRVEHAEDRSFMREIMAKQCGTDKEIAHYGFKLDHDIMQNRYDTLLGFKNSEILGLQNTERIVREVCSVKEEMKRLEIQNLRDKVLERDMIINGDRVISRLAPKPPMPAYFPYAEASCY